MFRIFPNGNELHFEYVNSEADGDAVLSHEDCREEFKFVAGKKQVKVSWSGGLRFNPMTFLKKALILLRKKWQTF